MIEFLIKSLWICSAQFAYPIFFSPPNPLFHQLNRGRRVGGDKREITGELDWPGLQEDLESVSKEGPRVPSTGQRREQHHGGSFEILCLCTDPMESEKL